MSASFLGNGGDPNGADDGNSNLEDTAPKFKFKSKPKSLGDPGAIAGGIALGGKAGAPAGG